MGARRGRTGTASGSAAPRPSRVPVARRREAAALVALLGLFAAGCSPLGGPLAAHRFTLPPSRGAPVGELWLHCQPEDAEVALDGVPQGRCSDFDGTHGALRLGLGERRVEVSKPGYASWDSRVTADRTRTIVYVTLLATSAEGR